MKRLILMILGCCLSSSVFLLKAAEDGQLHDYMVQMYGITDEQFKSYIDISIDFDTQLDELRSKRISVDLYKKMHRQLYDSYYKRVKGIFTEEQFWDWSTCIERLDRYRYLSERLYVPRNSIRKLYKSEKEWKSTREELWDSNIDESQKHQKNAELLSDLQDKIIQILGQEIAASYNEYKVKDNLTVRNMKKYSSSYTEAMKITEIEDEYKQKRQSLNADKSRRRVDIDADIIKCEKDKAEAIKRLLPDDVYERWQTINDNNLDYTLSTLYGMNKSQIREYKNAYNTYVLDEYLILESKKLTISEKKEKLVKANDAFCEKVKTFAPAETFNQWLGRRQYVFDRRMIQKGIR